MPSGWSQRGGQLNGGLILMSKEAGVVRADFSVVCSEGEQSVFSEEREASWALHPSAEGRVGH